MRGLRVFGRSPTPPPPPDDIRFRPLAGEKDTSALILPRIAQFWQVLTPQRRSKRPNPPHAPYNNGLRIKRIAGSGEIRLFLNPLLCCIGKGAHIRHYLDRDSDIYKNVYKQRTATERINSQAVALGIARSKLRNGQAIANQNTLIYVLINLCALQRMRRKLSHRLKSVSDTSPNRLKAGYYGRITRFSGFGMYQAANSFAAWAFRLCCSGAASSKNYPGPSVTWLGFFVTDS